MNWDLAKITAELWFWIRKNMKLGKNFADYFELTNDEVFEIGLTPNRTDAMSHYGVARDLCFLSTNQLNLV
jgi:hypothetical protein